MKETLKKQRLFFISIIGIVVVSLVMGTTFAYQTITMNESEQRNLVLKAGVLDVSFETTNVIENTNMSLLADYTEADYLEFTVDNTASTADAAFKINLTEIEYGYTNSSGNQVPGCTTDTCIVSEDFKYKIVEVDTDNSYDGNFSNLSSSSPYTEEYELTNYITIEKGTTKTYRLYLWLQETEDNQNSLENTYFMGKIGVNSVFTRDLNPYYSNTSSLAYNIINNSLSVTNGTQLMSYPLTKVAEEVSSQTEGNGKSYVPAYADITYYASTTDNLYACVDDGDCDNAIEYSTCTNDVIGKYIFDVYDWIEYGPVQGCDSEGNPLLGNAETVLSSTQDDYGTSYYYRGNVEDNYLNFAGMCWRIVRIDGNNNIKIVLEDQNTTCDSVSFTGNWNLGYGNYGYDSTTKSTSGSTLFKMNYLEPVSEASSSMVKAFYDYQSTLNTKISATYTNKTISDYLVSGNWCMADTAYSRSGSSSPYTYSLLTDTNSYYLAKTPFYYDSYVRLGGDSSDGYNPTLKCTGTVMDKFKNHTVDGTTITTETDMYVGALTADEIVYAGGKVSSLNVNYYLVNDYQESNWKSWLSMSPHFFSSTNDNAFYLDYDGSLSNSSVYSDGYFRPAVSLKSGSVITGGEGTLEKPYIIG